MYKVTNTLTSAYGPEAMDFRHKQGPDMPHVTVHNRRMTNVPIGSGEFVQGIRRNPIDELRGVSPLAGDAIEFPRSVRPLRYTPGLSCDAHLENLRPERDPKHPPMQGGDNWKRKLIQAPQTYDGSFNDADMQMFRPVPVQNPCEDPWYATRLPEQSMAAFDRLAMPAACYNDLSMGPYYQMHPQDELSRIKMRNRRYVNACAQENSLMNVPMFGGGPFMRGMPMNAPMGPSSTLDYEMAQDELAMLDQELNMTRRSTRPFIPVNSPNYFQLQRQVQDMEQPIETPRRVLEPPTSVEQLPLPKRTGRAPATEAMMASTGITASKPEICMSDKIAMRSLVLSKNMPRIGVSK
jgi:hypothetical protein